MNPRNADRDQAIASGRNKYQGKPCKHGHGGLRYVGKSSCVECVSTAKGRNGGKPE